MQRPSMLAMTIASAEDGRPSVVWALAGLRRSSLGPPSFLRTMTYQTNPALAASASIRARCFASLNAFRRSSMDSPRVKARLGGVSPLSPYGWTKFKVILKLSTLTSLTASAAASFRPWTNSRTATSHARNSSCSCAAWAVASAPEQQCHVFGVLRPRLLRKQLRQMRWPMEESASWLHPPITGKNVANPTNAQAASG